MDTRFIIYFVFICLKNFELSWVVCRINKVIRMNFVELGTITAFSEIAGFCFIVSRSQSADFLLWWKETVFLDRFACIGGFVIAVAVSTALLILLLLGCSGGIAFVVYPDRCFFVIYKLCLHYQSADEALGSKPRFSAW